MKTQLGHGDFTPLVDPENTKSDRVSARPQPSNKLPNKKSICSNTYFLTSVQHINDHLFAAAAATLPRYPADCVDTEARTVLLP